MSESTDANKVVIRPDVSTYMDTVSASGSKSKHNGDPVAVAIAGLSLEEVQEVAEAMGIEDGATKYAHLNIGQQRMALGNRIRGRRKAVEAENEALKKAAEADDAKAADKKAYDRCKDFDEQLEAACKGPRKEADAREKEAAAKKAAKTKKDD